MKPKKGRSLGYFSAPEDIWPKIGWCHTNAIGVSVMPDWQTASDWIVEVRINDKRHEDPGRYNAEAAVNKMYEYYEYYYDKYNNDE